MSISSVAYAHRLAPKGFGLTFQTVLEAMHTGFGIATGKTKTTFYLESVEKSFRFSK